jgi:hypothetical protein
MNSLLSLEGPGMGVGVGYPTPTGRGVWGGGGFLVLTHNALKEIVFCARDISCMYVKLSW